MDRTSSPTATATGSVSWCTSLGICLPIRCLETSMSASPGGCSPLEERWFPYNHCNSISGLAAPLPRHRNYPSIAETSDSGNTGNAFLPHPMALARVSTWRLYRPISWERGRHSRRNPGRKRHGLVGVDPMFAADDPDSSSRLHPIPDTNKHTEGGGLVPDQRNGFITTIPSYHCPSLRSSE